MADQTNAAFSHADILQTQTQPLQGCSLPKPGPQLSSTQGGVGWGGGSLTVSYEKQPNSFPGNAWQADGGPLAILQGRKGSKGGFAVVGETSHPR